MINEREEMKDLQKVETRKESEVNWNHMRTEIQVEDKRIE